jgi:hypothetical protein
MATQRGKRKKKQAGRSKTRWRSTALEQTRTNQRRIEDSADSCYVLTTCRQSTVNRYMILWIADYWNDWCEESPTDSIAAESQ